MNDEQVYRDALHELYDPIARLPAWSCLIDPRVATLEARIAALEKVAEAAVAAHNAGKGATSGILWLAVVYPAMMQIEQALRAAGYEVEE